MDILIAGAWPYANGPLHIGPLAALLPGDGLATTLLAAVLHLSLIHIYLDKGLCMHPPKNYFIDNDPEKPPLVTWRSHANLLYNNWLNYYVYQETPFDLTQID